MNLNIATMSLGVLSFGITALICWAAWRRRRGVWAILAVFHCLLAVEIMVMSRVALSMLLRDAVRSSAFYSSRTGWPAWIILCTLLCTALLVCWVLLPRITTVPARLAVLALLTILFLFVLETVSLHAVDALLYHAAGPVFVIGWLWLILSALTSAAAVWSLRRPPA